VAIFFKRYVMELTQEQIESVDPIGQLDDKKVYRVVTKGGLNLVVINKNAKTKILGAAPHKALAKYIAEKEEPEIQWTELAKSEPLDQSVIDAHYPRWSEFTKELQDY
jgi:hypothetical protein